MKRLFKILGWIFSFSVAIVGSALVLSLIRYPDHSDQIKPIAAELLQQVNSLRLSDEGNRTGSDWSRRIVAFLEEDGCAGAVVDWNKSGRRMDGGRDFWFSGHCRKPDGERVDVGVQRHGKSVYVYVRIGHSACFYGLGQKARCVSDSLVSLPGH